MERNILAIDQGTTGTTVIILDPRLRPLAKETTEILPEYPRAGWVEHDLNKIWDGTVATVLRALKASGTHPASIAAIGITNQRETIGAWNPRNMVPAGNAIVWQCRRTADYCQSLRERGLEAKVNAKTGLVLDPYFSASKIRWMLENISGLREKAEKGAAVFGTIDTFLLHRLTMGAVHATDATNASRTSLMDLKTLVWDDEMLALFEVPRAALPEIRPSSGVIGKTRGLQFLPDDIPICGILGDQQAALFGQLCWEPGDAKITYGTGCFLLSNTGTKPVFSKNKLLTTVAWQIGDKIEYALEGSAFMGGAAVQWLRDGLGIISKSSEVEALARSARDEDMGDLVLVPAMTGLGAPHWDANARGMLAGITRGTTKAHIARATLEGIAHQNDDLLSAMIQDSGGKIKSLKVDGGAAVNDFLMQLQCDLAGVALVRPQMAETTALGAGIAAGLAAGVWSSREEVRRSWQLDREFHPAMRAEEIAVRRERWQLAIKRCRYQ